ncbi:protein of unknown function [Solitalea koreensis]|uniref:DUF4160 domain-containing protein n=2 Tax=Solitalea koreensis TaxID=543615 RepID=A0A521DTI8_9SPHI|nr:protein of unknown function [Solitalea koreensis]
MKHMPEISRFYGIIIRMFFDDHNPPHFHVIYGEYKAEYDIRTLEVLVGELPNRANQFVLEWASLHKEELMINWNNLQNEIPANKIQPLE